MSLPGGGVPEPRSDQNFRALQRRIGELTARLGSFLGLAKSGEQAISFGTATLAFSASTLSSTLEVEHGLGATPEAVHIQLKTSLGAGGSSFTSGVSGLSKTKFKVQGLLSAEFTGELPVFWIAIG